MLGFLSGQRISQAIRYLAKMVPADKLATTRASGPPSISGVRQAVSEGASLPLEPSTAQLHRVAFLQYTGGATGLSIGAVLTHLNVIPATLQAEDLFQPALTKVCDVRESTACPPCRCITTLRSR